MTPAEKEFVCNWHIAHPEKEPFTLLDYEQKFVNRCKFYILKTGNPPKNNGRFAFVLSDARKQELIDLAYDELQAGAELETSTDPLRLDGQYIDNPTESENAQLDERTFRDELQNEHLNPHAAIWLHHATKQA